MKTNFPPRLESVLGTLDTKIIVVGNITLTIPVHVIDGGYIEETLFLNDTNGNSLTLKNLGNDEINKLRVAVESAVIDLHAKVNENVSS